MVTPQPSTAAKAVTRDRTAGRPIPVRADEAAFPFERQPSQDLTAEQSVLSGILLSKDAIADVVEVLLIR